MKKAIVLVLAIIGCYFVNTHSGFHEKLFGILEPQITIRDLKKSSVYADSLVELRNLLVIETQSVLNYSSSKVTDKTGEEMILFSNRPFKTNETIDAIKGRFTVLYYDKVSRYEVFISEDLKPFTDFITVFRHSLLSNI